MKKYEKEYQSLKHENSHYRKKYRDKLDFSLEDMQNFWDDIYGHAKRAGESRVQ
jgi:hypothetical protein